MKLVVKEDILDYTVTDDLQPMLIFDPDLMWGEYNNGELLSTKLVRSLYMDFVEQLGERLKDSLTERMEIKSAKQLL